MEAHFGPGKEQDREQERARMLRSVQWSKPWGWRNTKEIQGEDVHLPLPPGILGGIGFQCYLEEVRQRKDGN